MSTQNLTVRKLPEPPEAPEEPDMNAVYLKAYEDKTDDLIKLLAKTASSKDGAKIIKRLPGFDGKNDIKELQKNPEAFIKSFLKNEENLEELLDTIQDSKLGDKLITLLEKTSTGKALFKEIDEKIENELSEYNEAMLQYEDALTAYETALDDFINPAFLPQQDEAAVDKIIAQAEADAEEEVTAEDVAAVVEEELLPSEEEVEDEEIISDEEVVTDGGVLVDGEMALEEEISDEEIVAEDEVLIDGEVTTEEEITQG